MKSNPAVNWFFEKSGPWQEAYALLRTVLLDGGLQEVLKWGHPCYTVDGKNVVLIHGFKGYCALLFPKGALLPDASGLLVQQTSNTQAARQLRFEDAATVETRIPIIESYIKAAIEVEKQGLEVQLKTVAEFDVAPEFQRVLDTMPDVEKAFEALTPGRRKAYLLHFSSAKQAATREARISKCIPAILNGKGLND